MSKLTCNLHRDVGHNSSINENHGKYTKQVLNVGTDISQNPNKLRNSFQKTECAIKLKQILPRGYYHEMKIISSLSF